MGMVQARATIFMLDRHIVIIHIQQSLANMMPCYGLLQCKLATELQGDGLAVFEAGLAMTLFSLSSVDRLGHCTTIPSPTAIM